MNMHGAAIKLITPNGDSAMDDTLDAIKVAPQSSISSATATMANVSDTDASTTLIAANTSRKGATIFNDSTAVLYVKFGSTASATSFVNKLGAGAYWEIPFGYTGIITGIWASDASGAARVCEFT